MHALLSRCLAAAPSQHCCGPCFFACFPSGSDGAFSGRFHGAMNHKLSSTKSTAEYFPKCTVS